MHFHTKVIQYLLATLTIAVGVVHAETIDEFQLVKNDVVVFLGGTNMLRLHFWFSINGKPSSEFIEGLPKEKRLKSEMIQLQLHDPGMIVEFKDLWIKVLDKPKKQRLDGAVEADELSLEQANRVMEAQKRRYMEFVENIAAAVKIGKLSEEEAEKKLIAAKREMFEGTP